MHITLQSNKEGGGKNTVITEQVTAFLDVSSYVNVKLAVVYLGFIFLKIHDITI